MNMHDIDTLPQRVDQKLNTNCVMGDNAIWIARRIPFQSKEVVEDTDYFQVVGRTRSYSVHVRENRL